MKRWVGTSGYSYKEWKGHFYPADLKNDQMLAHYGRSFPTVEINNTFYRLPKKEVLERWKDQVPDGFRFVLKASRRITHLSRLNNVEEPLQYLLDTSESLEDKRGPFLFQLPPNMKKDRDRLAKFLQLLGDRGKAAVEFRHESWFDEEIYDVLRDHGAALCVSDERTDEPSWTATAEFGYVRFRQEAYDTGTLGELAAKLASQPWDEAYVFFKHEEGAPELAKRFQDAAGS